MMAQWLLPSLHESIVKAEIAKRCIHCMITFLHLIPNLFNQRIEFPLHNFDRQKQVYEIVFNKNQQILYCFLKWLEKSLFVVSMISIAPLTGRLCASSLIVACFGSFSRTASSSSRYICMSLQLYYCLVSQGSGLSKSDLMQSPIFWVQEVLAMRSNWLNSGYMTMIGMDIFPSTSSIFTPSGKCSLAFPNFHFLSRKYFSISLTAEFFFSSNFFASNFYFSHSSSASFLNATKSLSVCSFSNSKHSANFFKAMQAFPIRQYALRQVGEYLMAILQSSITFPQFLYLRLMAARLACNLALSSLLLHFFLMASVYFSYASFMQYGLLGPCCNLLFACFWVKEAFTFKFSAATAGSYSSISDCKATRCSLVDISSGNSLRKRGCPSRQLVFSSISSIVSGFSGLQSSGMSKKSMVDGC